MSEKYYSLAHAQRALSFSHQPISQSKQSHIIIVAWPDAFHKRAGLSHNRILIVDRRIAFSAAPWFITVCDYEGVLMNEVFLGGTCASNRWREEIVIPSLLEAGVPQDAIFNPNLGPGMWNEQAQALEDQAKQDCSLMVYYIGDTQDGTGVSLYSAVEATMALYDDAARTFVVIDATGTEGHVTKALNKTLKDLKRRFPAANIEDNLQALISFIVQKYGRR
jgi:hypothetical protein